MAIFKNNPVSALFARGPRLSPKAPQPESLLAKEQAPAPRHVKIPAHCPPVKLVGLDALKKRLAMPFEGQVEFIEADLSDPNIPATKGYHAVIARFANGSAVTSNTNGVKFGPANLVLEEAGYDLLADPVAAKKDVGGSNRFSAGMFATTAARPVARVLDDVVAPVLDDKFEVPVTDDAATPVADDNAPAPISDDVVTTEPAVDDSAAAPMPTAEPASPVAALMTHFKQEVTKMEIPLGDNKILEQTTITTTMSSGA